MHPLIHLLLCSTTTDWVWLLFHEVSRLHTTHHSRKDSSGQVISSSQRPLPDNTQHSQQTNVHAPGGIRTHDSSRRAAADLRLRPRGHWDRHQIHDNIKFNPTYENKMHIKFLDLTKTRKQTNLETDIYR